jgi:hypothetical protein
MDFSSVDAYGAYLSPRQGALAVALEPNTYSLIADMEAIIPG